MTEMFSSKIENGINLIKMPLVIDHKNSPLFEKAQDAYLEVMQNLAENAFTLLLDSGLAATGEKITLSMWRKMGQEAIFQKPPYHSRGC